MSLQTPKVVQEFLKKTMLKDFDKYQILDSLRNNIFELFPDTEERFMYGGIMLFENGQDFGGLFVYKNHVSLELSAGSTFQDPENHLEGNGKFRRHLKFRTLDDISGKDAHGFLMQAREDLNDQI